MSRISTQVGMGPPEAAAGWQPLRIGAGGWITGLDVSPDGTTRLLRTDTYGAYIWDSTADEWQQLCTTTRMPSSVTATVEGHADGVYEIRVAPSDPTRIYMAWYGKVYRSDNRGVTFQDTNFTPVSPMSGNDGPSKSGPKMAVDPANADVVYVGTPSHGVWVTTDAGSSWTKVTAIPDANPAGQGFSGMVFDPNSGTTEGRTNTCYVGSWGNAVYRTTNAGSTWAVLGSGGPSNLGHGAVATDGIYWCTTDTAEIANRIWKCDSGTWTDVSPAWDSNFWSIMPDPNDAARVAVGETGGQVLQTLNRGTTWTEPMYNQIYFDTTGDIPWLDVDEGSTLSTGDMRFDPQVANKLLFGFGIGYAYATLTTTATSITWHTQSRGIEQLVATVIVSPPNGKPVVGCWDRGAFYVDDPEVFPSDYKPVEEFLAGWSVDYASSNPATIVGVLNWYNDYSGKSSDGGVTWSQFATKPPWAGSFYGGCIAASSANNFIWVPANLYAPYYTTNGGTSWTKVVISGISDSGWGYWTYYLNRNMVCADRVASNTFYIYVTGSGVYRSTDGGANWTQRYSGDVVAGSGFGLKMRTVPGQEGHLFLSIGNADGEVPTSLFKRSTDGGTTWTTVADVLEVWDFGFGKEAPGESYPAIYIAGWVGGDDPDDFGVWQSTDNCATWTKLAMWPLGIMSQIRCVCGDSNTYGICYVGFGGAGWAYYTP